MFIQMSIFTNNSVTAKKCSKPYFGLIDWYVDFMDFVE